MLTVTSLGPQSAVLLHLLGRQRIPAYWISMDPPTDYQQSLIDHFHVMTVLSCGATKRDMVEHLIRKRGADIWFTGIRRCQTPERAEMRAVEDHLGAIRIAPLFEWSDERVMDYLQKHGLPHRPLPETKVECGLHVKEG